MQNTTSYRIKLWGSLALSALIITACTAVDWGAFERTTSAADDRVQAQIDYWAAQEQQAINEGDDERAVQASNEQAYYEALQKQLADTTEDVDKIRERLSDPETGEFSPERAIQEGSALLPYPFNLILGIGGPLGIGLFQEWRLRRQSAQKQAQTLEIIKAIDEGRKASPSMADAMSDPQVKTAMWEALSPETFSLIEEHRNT